MRKVIPHVVAAEGQHSHRIPTDDSDSSGCRCSGFRGEGSAKEGSVLPTARLEYQRNAPLPPSSKEHGINRYAVWILELRRNRSTLRGRRRKTTVGMGRFFVRL